MLSKTARFAVAVQSVKGTVATTGFHAMRVGESSAQAVFDYEEALNEHTGVHQRASDRQSTPDRISKSFRINGNGLLYPNAIGTLLVGVGFAASTTDNTTSKSHAFTKTDTDDAKWLSVMHALGEGSARFERKIKDVRLTQLQLAATRNNLTVSFDGLGLDEAASAGTETVAAEALKRIIPSTGSLTFGTLALGEPRSHTITLARPVEEDDQKLHSFGRADALETGFAVNGQLRGLDMSYNTYKKLNWGGTSGTAPDDEVVTDSLTVTWQSAANITGAAVPYSITFAFTKVELRMVGSPVARGADIIRCDVDYAMIDDVSAAPVTVTVVNTVSSY